MAAKILKFKVGDLVTWTSQSQGSTTTKTGRVFAVVPADTLPQLYLCGFTGRSGGGFGCPRDHESYLVKVGNSRRLYWPLVKKLKKAKAKKG